MFCLSLDSVRNAVGRRGPNQMGMGPQMPQPPHGPMGTAGPMQPMPPHMAGHQQVMDPNQYDPNHPMHSAQQQQQQQQLQPGQQPVQPGQPTQQVILIITLFLVSCYFVRSVSVSRLNAEK